MRKIAFEFLGTETKQIAVTQWCDRDTKKLPPLPEGLERGSACVALVREYREERGVASASLEFFAPLPK